MTIHDSIDWQVRRWLYGKPGAYFADHPLDTLTAAHSDSGIQCAVDDFAAAVERAGYRPRPHAKRFCLALPEKPGGVIRQ